MTMTMTIPGCPCPHRMLIQNHDPAPCVSLFYHVNLTPQDCQLGILFSRNNHTAVPLNLLTQDRMPDSIVLPATNTVRPRVP
jgi:hypothetical protein